METADTTTIETIFGDLPALETSRLILRKVKLEDAPDMFAYARDPEVSRFTVWSPHITMEDTLRFLGCVIKGYEKGAVENWGIVHKEDNKFIGTCGYFSWEPEHFRGDIHYALSPAYNGKGIMTEAVNAVLRFGFEQMGLNRIEANCMPENIASERVMQKAGMRFEGIMRERIFAKGRFHDVKVYAILLKDWREKR